MAALTLLLLGVGALFSAADAQEAYNKLPVDFKTGVDLALQQLNNQTGIPDYFHFYKSLTQSDIETDSDGNFIFHNFIIKATKCRRGPGDQSDRRFRSDRPPIDCAACYKIAEGIIDQDPKPYIHCAHQSTFTEEMLSTRVEQCYKIAHSSGANVFPLSTGTK